MKPKITPEEPTEEDLSRQVEYEILQHEPNKSSMFDGNRKYTKHFDRNGTSVWRCSLRADRRQGDQQGCPGKIRLFKSGVACLFSDHNCQVNEFNHDELNLDYQRVKMRRPVIGEPLIPTFSDQASSQSTSQGGRL